MGETSSRRPTTATSLCGGLGGARWALALQQEGLDAAATFVTNVGDDWWVGGLRVCPDTDAVLYALAGVFDEERGWGVRDDAFPGPREGEPAWFGLGDRDRAQHEERSRLLESGLPLSDAVAALATRWEIEARVVPVTSQPLETQVTTDHGVLRFQEWLVRERGGPAVLDVGWPTAQEATPSAGVLDAIADADVVVVTSSSPVASVEPILAVPGVRETLGARNGPVVALAPVVAGVLPVLDRDRHRAHAREALLAARGLRHDPVAAMSAYSGLCTHVVLDPADEGLVGAVEALGLTALVAPVLDQGEPARRALVEAVLSTLQESP